MVKIGAHLRTLSQKKQWVPFFWTTRYIAEGLPFLAFLFLSLPFPFPSIPISHLLQ